MEAAPTSMPTMGVQAPRGGYRGRGGGGPPMRGGYERGRGRGMGRGHYMGGGMGRGGGPGGMGGGPPPGMMSSVRGMRPPRGGGYQGRGGYVPRGGPMRGGRPPIYAQPPKQHTGAENNKTVSPVPTSGTSSSTPIPTEVDASTAVTTLATTGGVIASAPAPSEISAVPVNGNESSGAPPPYIRGPPRGRGSFSRGGRGGYNPHTNGGYNSGYGGMGGGPSMEHNQMPMRRGGPPRGRGGYGQSMPRAPMHQQHSANTQIAPVPSLKRGAPGGPPGPKRGRYEGGPYSQRPMAPKYHQTSQHVASIPPQSHYGAPPSHHQPQQSHHGYASHEQSQTVDPYAQSYVAPTAQSYNGYGQSSGYATHATPAAQPQSSASYASSEYDSQYQSYNTSTYGTQPDTRYQQSYGQDYTQQYGAPAVDYNSAPQADYSQHSQQAGYDERAYAGYDTQTYQQSYSNAAGYY